MCFQATFEFRFLSPDVYDLSCTNSHTNSVFITEVKLNYILLFFPVPVQWRAARCVTHLWN